MNERVVTSKNAINLMAGLVGIAFDQLERPLAVLESPVVKKDAADDLTEINGIGPTFARRLNEAGINSFARLAALEPQALREIAQVKEWQGDPLEWIAEAKNR